MGLGKTVQTVSVVNHLFEKLNIWGPFLIVAPLITVPHWQREFEGWTNMNTIVYHGTAESRELIVNMSFITKIIRVIIIQKNQEKRKIEDLHTNLMF